MREPCVLASCAFLKSGPLCLACRFVTGRCSDSEQEEDGSSSGKDSDDEEGEGSSSSSSSTASGSGAAGSSSGYDTDVEGGGSSALEGASSGLGSTIGGGHPARPAEGLVDTTSSRTSETGDEEAEVAGSAEADAGTMGESLAQLTLMEQQRRAAVTAKLTEQQRKAARRAAMASQRRNTSKSKNAGKRPGADATVGGGGW